MKDWSLPILLEKLHEEIETKLSIARSAIAHPGSKGDASESVWLNTMREYLPKRYQTERAFVVDSNGGFSNQIDVVIFDRQYSPFIFRFNEQIVVPAESVYAVFEAKQSINADVIEYAKDKISSVRRLHRTSLPIPYAGGTYKPKPLIHIYGGVLSLSSDWKPQMGKSLTKSLADNEESRLIDLGCVASSGYFFLDDDRRYQLRTGGKPATSFLFRLISHLQTSATVPMIDVQAYAAWLDR